MKSFAGAVILFAIASCANPVSAQSPMPRGGGASQPSSGPQDGGSAVTGRIERLEQQVVDLQAVIAAVETLAKNNSGGGGGYAASSGGGAGGEQIRQLSEQIADLTQRLERLEARLGSAGGAPPRSQAGLPSGFEDKEQLPPLTSPAPDRAPAPRPTASQQPYGSAPDARPATPRNPAPDNFASAQPRTPSLAPPGNSSSGGARALFDQATGAFNRREYSAAETYFQQFLEQYPSDGMAGTAQYWLGESAFVSGEYKSAADRFLKTFTDYPNNDKAPEALLKLAISLRRLGENNAACDSFAELARRFPQAPKTIAQRADAEKRRANCS
jgi:tol-pal system protein YbgF